MNLSFSIGKVAGIPIRIHGLFLLIMVLWILPSAFIGGRIQPWPFIIFGVLFASVVLHELAHALVARRFAAEIVDITLWPLGGFTRMRKMPEAALPEFLVAVAGPFVNLGLTLAAFAAGGQFYYTEEFAYFPSRPLNESALDWMAWINAILGCSNLIPAFPMDGGRALRAIFTSRFGYLKATEAAVRVGRWFIVLGVITAFWYLDRPWLYVFIGIFLWWQGTSELAAVRLRYGINPLHMLISKMFGGKLGNEQQMEEMYQRARQQQEAASAPRQAADTNDKDLNRDLESFRGSLDEYFKERKKRE